MHVPCSKHKLCQQDHGQVPHMLGRCVQAQMQKSEAGQLKMGSSTH